MNKFTSACNSTKIQQIVEIFIFKVKLCNSMTYAEIENKFHYNVCPVALIITVIKFWMLR